jgi:hypothetical protein
LDNILKICLKILGVTATSGTIKRNELSDLKIKYFLFLFEMSPENYGFVDSNHRIVI